MAAVRRLQNELHELRAAGLKEVREVATVGENVFLWEVLVAPESPPYDKGAFKVELLFPPEYPLKPPLLTFRTPIFHPNIDEKGRVCLPLVSADNWKATIRPEQVLQVLLALVKAPEPENPLRHDLAQLFLVDRPNFDRIAQLHTLKHAIKLDEGQSEPQ